MSHFAEIVGEFVELSGSADATRATAMNFVRNLFATPAKAPPKLTADFFQYEGGQWNPVGNESAYTTSLPVDEVYELWGWHFKGSDCMS